MPEIKANEKSASVAPPSGPPPVGPDQTQHYLAADAAKAPNSVPEADSGPDERTPVAAETKPLEARAQQGPRPQARASYLWAIVPMALLLAALIFFITRPGKKAGETGVAANPQAGETKPDLSNYSAFVAKNKSLIEKYSEQVLTDEPFAGQAPLATAVSGALVSAEADPQLAALADALKVRVQVMQGSQAQTRDNAVIRVTKGDFRGFKVQAFEKLENGKLVAEETVVTTPKNGLIKTVGRVLTVLQKTDQAGLISEIRAAGMDFSFLSDEKHCRGQLRLPQYWGKPIPPDRLISGENVGRVSLGMPLAQLKSRIAATDSVLKRKVLINDVYHDVYKISDQGGNPLFFVYEKAEKVLGIWVVSESFKTGKGIGINSSLDQIRINYPAIILSRSEKKIPFIKVDGVAGILIIQNEGEKKVVAILIGDSPEFI